MARTGKYSHLPPEAFTINSNGSRSIKYSWMTEEDKARKLESQKRLLAKNPDYLKDYKKKYREINRERLSKERSAWQKNNPERVMFKHAKVRANKKNIPFNLELSDIIIPEYCPVLGIKLERGSNNISKLTSPSLDRIVPELGYVKGNIIVISLKANMIKSSATPNEIQKVADFYTNLEKRDNVTLQVAPLLDIGLRTY